MLLANIVSDKMRKRKFFWREFELIYQVGQTYNPIQAAYAMSKYRRIFIETLAPPFLGACILEFKPGAADSLVDRILGFFPGVIAAYVYAIVPAILYMLVMETWFWLGLRTRYGLLCTAAFSALLGSGAGLVIEYLVDLGQILSLYFVWVGGLIGFLIGFYVGRKAPSAA